MATVVSCSWWISSKNCLPSATMPPNARHLSPTYCMALTEETAGRVVVVIALRADFYAHCSQFASLREMLAQHQVYIGPMSPDELRRAIEEPAKAGAWTLEPGLVDLILDDLGDEPGALPLLSHALLETWRQRQGRTLTFASYVESGGVRGAIARTAETTYERLTHDEQAIARSIFLRLTELGEDTQDTRRRATLAELVRASRVRRRPREKCSGHWRTPA